ncbi:hypothetical protein H4R35_003978 [Dimargaris xerosporica]|nr:hypothetical protein H4R35_003978 [Dimargaris xerosporica]
MGIDVTEFRADIDRILRNSNLATVTSRKVRKQLEAEKCVCLSRVRRPLDTLINRCYRAICAAPVRTAAPAVVHLPAEYQSTGFSQSIPNFTSWRGKPILPCIPHSMPGIGPIKRLLPARAMGVAYHTPKGCLIAPAVLRKMNAKLKGKTLRNPNPTVRLSPQLAELAQVTQTTREKAVALVIAYIKAHKLLSPGRRAVVTSDAKLKALTGKDHLYIVELNTLLTSSMTVIDDEPDNLQQEIDSDES